MGSSPANTCGSVVSRDCSTTLDRVRIPQLDEETGRMVQGPSNGFRVVDTAMLYNNTESE